MLTLGEVQKRLYKFLLEEENWTTDEIDEYLKDKSIYKIREIYANRFSKRITRRGY